MKAEIKCEAALGTRDFGAFSADDTKFSVVSCNVRCGTSSKGGFYLDATNRWPKQDLYQVNNFTRLMRSNNLPPNSIATTSVERNA